MTKFRLGLDEVGYGSWAGNLTCCGVLAPIPCLELENLAARKVIGDSKKLSEKKRKIAVQELQKLLDAKIIELKLVEKSVEEIDFLKLGGAQKQAFSDIIASWTHLNPEVIVDGRVEVPVSIPVQNLEKADSTVPEVMAASCWAKVYRDNLMIDLAKNFPQYGWETNMGYASKAHKAAIREFGMTIFHRKSFNIKL